MNIAMFTDAYLPRINGVAISVHSYALELTNLGHNVCVVCLEYSEEQQKSALFDEKVEDLKTPFKIVRIPSTSLIWSKEDRVARFDKWIFLKKAMDKFRPDIIHINSEWVVGYFGAIYALHRHIPYVFTFHTLWEDYLYNYVSFLPEASTRKIGREIVKFYLKRATVIIAPTQRIADVVKEYGVDRKVELLPTGIPDWIFKYSFERDLKIHSQIFSSYPSIADKKILLYVGRVVKEKNLAFLLNVFELVKQKEYKTALMFVGDGPYLEELKELAAERGFGDDVIFTGYAARTDLLYYYKHASVFVFPSLTDTQGLVTVEAMMNGLPVVAIGEMGTLDVMQGDNGGFMVKNDVGEFAERVCDLIENPYLHRKKSAEALEWAKKWSMGALVKDLVLCYEKAIKLKKEER
ncbi:glycosyltransferase [Treponema parvum]|uniref:Glycosyltransferase n=1 Tax=Treponema parvum TaxID=138851 RepID=A0A975IES6_9SPIR|nr:glycosyltransferase [Treponema parvum]QTQ14142.1 glycosyltransferase [Treponema parvum]